MAANYPVGIQTFEEIINQKMTYVDKTALVYKLANGSKNYFLCRPRRFGKSLLITTLQAYFEGRRALFKGLAMESLEKDWVEYPVIHLDLSRGKYYSLENTHGVLNMVLGICEEQYNIVPTDRHDYSARLNKIIRSAVEQTGKKAVVLIDEYDAPMLDSIANEALQSQIRDIMRDFFSPLKANEGIERFVFLTGITKFSQLSIFSELNNITNISLKDEFSAICGITNQEVLDNFQEGITELAKANNITFDKAVERLRQKYDGYRFSAHGPNIYNPYSLLNALTDKDFQNYWFSTGTPTFLLELLRKNNVLAPQLESIAASADRFDQPTERISDPLPVLYQSGYVSIKRSEGGMYLLGFPNDEVREGFNMSLLRYIAPNYLGERDSFAWDFRQAMYSDDIDTAMNALQVFLSGFPYDAHLNREEDFQAILYTIFETLNFTIRAEARTAAGRVDILVQTPTAIFVMELKIDKTAEKALRQIDDRHYALPWKHDGRKVFKVGINFSAKERTVTEWKWAEEA